MHLAVPTSNTRSHGHIAQLPTSPAKLATSRHLLVAHVNCSLAQEQYKKRAAAHADLTEQEKKIKKAQLEEKNAQARRRAMGNMTFVGFLYRFALVTEKIVHVCIQDLLGEPTPEEIECASKLISTAGPALAVRPCCPCPICAFNPTPLYLDCIFYARTRPRERVRY